MTFLLVGTTVYLLNELVYLSLPNKPMFFRPQGLIIWIPSDCPRTEPPAS